MTPYDPPLAGDFIQAAVFDPGPGESTEPDLTVRLRAMRDTSHVNTVNVYALESWDASGSNARKNALLTALANLRLKVIVRLERYDATRFAFTVADLDYVFACYDPLLRYLSTAGRGERVAYFALNMPVDDAGVQQRLGGINSALSRQRQQQYAQAFVDRLRTTLYRYGFPGAQAYLSVFYGWDNSYDLPSYAQARPDGYFLTNYSYPGAAVADENASDAELINEARLRIAVRRFTDQYGGAPVVIEYGFHTVEFNGGTPPHQTAGLVATVRAKRRALPATTRFYRANVAALRGTSYFAYNLFKQEGSPPALLDWALDYTALSVDGLGATGLRRGGGDRPAGEHVRAALHTGTPVCVDVAAGDGEPGPRHGERDAARLARGQRGPDEAHQPLSRYGDRADRLRDVDRYDEFAGAGAGVGHRHGDRDPTGHRDGRNGADGVVGVGQPGAERVERPVGAARRTAGGRQGQVKVTAAVVDPAQRPGDR
jgi:hypothetical protein